MSRNHASTAHEVNHLVQEVQRLSDDEIQNLYGIEIRDKGVIFDPTYDMTFTSIGEWAEFNVEQDHVEYSEDFHGYYDYDE